MKELVIEKAASVIDARRKYIEAGLFPIPLRHKSKRPTGMGWTKATKCPPESEFSNDRNIGIRLGSIHSGASLIALDLDADDGVADPHDETGMWLFERPLLNGAPRIISGNGYKVLLLVKGLPKSAHKITEGKSTGKTGGKFKIGVWIGTGCQIMAPPSIHPDTNKENEWDGGHKVPVVSLAELIKLLPWIKDEAWIAPKHAQKGTSRASTAHLIEDRVIQAILKRGAREHGKSGRWHRFDCPFSHEHDDKGALNNGFQVGTDKNGNLQIICFHSCGSGHSKITTDKWLAKLGLGEEVNTIVSKAAVDIYGEFPTKEAVANEVVKEIIWWTEKGPSGRSDCWTMKEGDLLSVVGQRAKDQQRDCARRMRALFNMFPRVAKEQERQSKIRSKEIAPEELPADDAAIAAMKMSWTWLDDIVRKERWVKEIRRAICGIRTGRQYHNGIPYLVQTAASFVTAKKGSCQWTLRFMRNKLIDPDDNDSIQFWTFMHHLQRQVVRLTSRDFKMRCQAGFIIGKPSIGKSLCLNHIILPLLGGRAAEVWAEASNANNNFNSQMAEAEVLICDDTIRAIPLAGRQKFESILKSLVGAGTIALERKGVDCITLHDHPASFWGLLNDDDSVGGLPTISEGSENKWNIYYFADTPIEVVDGGYEFALEKERSAFVHWLINGEMVAECRKELADDGMDYEDFFDAGDPNQHEDIKRFGMMAYHHETGRQQFTQTDPSTEMIQFIDALAISRNDWEGTAGEFVEYLLEQTDRSRVLQSELSKICMGKIGAKMGYMLRRLSKTHPHRVQAIGMKRAGTIWRIVFAS